MPWQAAPPLPARRGALAAVTADAPAPQTGTRIYAIGGWDGSADITPGTAAAYDTQTHTWTAVAGLPTPRSRHGAATTPGRVHVLGGYADDVMTADHTVYQPALNAWSAATPLPTLRVGLAAVTGPDGLVYAIGGSDDHHVLDVVEAYDPATDTWITKAPMPSGRSDLAAVTGLDGLIYTLGGTTSLPDNKSATVRTYNPATNTWTHLPDLPSVSNELAAAVGPNGFIYAIGGFVDADDNVTSSVYTYDPAHPDAGWTTTVPLSTARAFLAAATGPDGLVYAIGGQGGALVFDSVEAYAFSPHDYPPGHVDHVKVKEVAGILIGGLDRDGGGGVVIGKHFIPIPPRSPAMTAILQAATPHLSGAVEHPHLSQLVQGLGPDAVAKGIAKP